MVLALDDKCTECICQGKGIGFSVIKGQSLNASSIERIFYPETQAESNRWQALFAEMPESLIELGQNVIDVATNVYHLNLPDRVLLPICDHMQGAIERYRQGIVINNPMLEDIKRIYPNEYLAGQDAVKKIKDYSGIEMLEDEAAFLAYHFVIHGLGRN